MPVIISKLNFTNNTIKDSNVDCNNRFVQIKYDFESTCGLYHHSKHAFKLHKTCSVIFIHCHCNHLIILNQRM